MKKLLQCVLFLSIMAGAASPSLALCHKVKYCEIPALRRLKAEHRAKKAAKKMAAKKHWFGWGCHEPCGCASCNDCCAPCNDCSAPSYDCQCGSCGGGCHR